MSFLDGLQSSAVRLLRWSERYTKTDMVYLAKGGFWMLFGQAGAVVFSLALAIIFGHFATQDTYGNYKYIITLGSLLSALSLSGLGTAVTRSAARGDEGVLSQGFSLNFKYSWLLFGAGICASIYYFSSGNVFVGTGLLIATVALPFINGFSLYDPFLVGLREFKLESLYSVGSLAFTTIVLGITLLFFSQRAIVLVGVYFATNLISDALWYAITTRRARNVKNDPELLHYSFHLSVMGVIAAIADKIDSIIIFTFLGPAQLAVYTYAIAMPEQIKALVKSIVPISMPKFAQRPLTSIRENIWGRLFQLTLALAGGIVLYIVLAPFIFRYLFPIYIGSTAYSQWYALSIIVTGAYTAIISVFQAHKRTRELYFASNSGSILLIIILPFLTYFYGIWGAIASQFIYRLFATLVACWQLVRLREE